MGREGEGILTTIIARSFSGKIKCINAEQGAGPGQPHKMEEATLSRPEVDSDSGEERCQL